jgi:hypothetical protein
MIRGLSRTQEQVSREGTSGNLRNAGMRAARTFTLAGFEPAGTIPQVEGIVSQR